LYGQFEPLSSRGWHVPQESFQEGIVMGKEARLALLLAASACLLAVMVDWVVEELK
jgi:hypothetical protein